MFEATGKLEDWMALRQVLDYADMALHAHARGFDAPAMPSPEEAKDWLERSWVLRKKLMLLAHDKQIAGGGR